MKDQQDNIYNDVEKSVDAIIKKVGNIVFAMPLALGKPARFINALYQRVKKKSGGYMGSPVAQQNHLNSNYTHVVRHGINFGVNVFGQMLAVNQNGSKKTYSMGCNTDICIEAIEELKKKDKAGIPVAAVAEVNPNLPYMS